MQKVFEGTVRYETEANDFFLEWANLETSTGSYSLMDMFKDMMKDGGWKDKKVRITIEIID